MIEFNALLDNSVGGNNDAGVNRDNTFNVFLNATTANGATSNDALKPVWSSRRSH